MEYEQAEDIAVFAGFIAGMFADGGYAARARIFSGDSVAVAWEPEQARKRVVLPFLPLFRFSLA